MNEISFDNNWEQLGKYPIVTEHDIVKIRQLVRHHAKEARMGIVEQTRITTAVSELFRNMFNYAEGGDVLIERGNIDGKNALIVTCIDQGPGIEDLELAMSDGYTSGMGMGYGLPGTKRLVDRFEIQSEKDKGTIVRVMKWR
ncbi:serine/threonine-protein kinase RsbT [Draconibacterium orientale]|uniref:Serine/threonine protein kinase n=1 Tax=Draconibacterium orientale TaxID=1168034 RepID=X5DEA4_9BACT|nr:anti-sigma regulatory factor [Draconibacterium orientale]AHW61228.1 serine/threonine protein kinase [Draconibacterium orientale]SET95194.1 serine/threonine-protein kinase RsbT [Draconibacterium orientale]